MASRTRPNESPPTRQVPQHDCDRIVSNFLVSNHLTLQLPTCGSASACRRELSSSEADLSGVIPKRGTSWSRRNLPDTHCCRSLDDIYTTGGSGGPPRSGSSLQLPNTSTGLAGLYHIKPLSGCRTTSAAALHGDDGLGSAVVVLSLAYTVQRGWQIPIVISFLGRGFHPRRNEEAGICRSGYGFVCARPIHGFFGEQNASGAPHPPSSRTHKATEFQLNGKHQTRPD
jgi:hypothetical protein